MPNAGCQWRCLLGLFCLTQLWIAGETGFLEDHFPASVLEDAKLTTLQLLAKYKYPGEMHTVTTADKYVLQMHRISRPGAKPVLLMHGLLDSSATWIMLGPHSGLGYFLYNAGYDVWMANARGTRYSRSHVKLNPNTDKAYWSFSWHEIGYYDLPALIDAVLAKTGYEKLSYFGHSQGTTTFFVMASTRPEYNAKIHVMSALAPVAFMGNMECPLKRIAPSLLNVVGEAQELLSHSKISSGCVMSEASMQACMQYMGRVLGKNPAEFNKTIMPVIMGHAPSGASSTQVLHYLQLHKSDRFCEYDHDTKENQRIYGRARPPDYPLEKITAPVALYYTQNDYMSAVVDVKRLIKHLPNVVEDHMYPYKKWNHIDMIWGISARRLAQPRMLEVMQFYEAGGPQNGTQLLTTESSEETTNMTTEMVEVETETEIVGPTDGMFI
ncbi:lipase 1-like [Drosophila hydei]|uniref:Lipase n=1 Tax=Drosophila hydei TaxID=7224 RepID=A0A6J2SX02_DROHY|nr:lipase 1-like [Drosophila hydei]